MQHKLISFLIIAAICLGNAGSTLYFPAMPLIAKSLNADETLIKLSLSFFLLGYAISSLIYGPLSDAIGRKINLTIGIGIFFIGCLLSAFSKDVYFFNAGRWIQGLGIGSCTAVGYSVMRDIFHGIKLTQQLSYVSIFVGLMPLVAPIIGGYIISYYPWPWCFFFLAFVAIVLILLKTFLLKETRPMEHKQSFHPKKVLHNYLNLLKSPTYLHFSLLCSIAFAGIFTMGCILPFLIVQQLGVSPKLYGWIAGIPSIGYVLGAYSTARLAGNISLKKMILFGSSLSFSAILLGLFIAPIGFNLYTLIIPLFIFMLGTGFLVPTSSSGAMLPFPHLAGSASALLMSFMFMLAALITAFSSQFAIKDSTDLFLILIALPILAFLIAWNIQDKVTEK